MAVIDKVKAAGLREPEFIGGEVDLRVNIYRGRISDCEETNCDVNDLNSANKVPNSADKVPDSAVKIPYSTGKMPDSVKKVPDNEQERLIYQYVLEKGTITTIKAMELLSVKQRRARSVLSVMVESGWLRKEGAARSTIYVKNTEGK
ncbi:MAG: hypothetical protein Q4C91_03750 [Eubacteriales bacterium]|nr:hypothetical protein [Eubacteriales bacterium]